jgi:hypothetical protein
MEALYKAERDQKALEAAVARLTAQGLFDPANPTAVGERLDLMVMTTDGMGGRSRVYPMYQQVTKGEDIGYALRFSSHAVKVNNVQYDVFFSGKELPGGE